MIKQPHLKRKLDIAFPFSTPVTRLCAFSVMKMAKKPLMSPHRLVGQDTRVREYAVKLNDTLLFAKLSAGDLIAQEAKYHSKCLVSLYNRASRIEMKNDKVESKKERQIHDAYKQGLENILAFKDDISPALKMVCLEYFDNEFVNMSKAATFVRKDIFASNSEFKGTFPKGYQEAYVPQSLLTLRVNLPPAILRFREPDIPLVEKELSIDMSSFPAALKGGNFKSVKRKERYVVLLYDRSSTANMMNELRKQSHAEEQLTIFLQHEMHFFIEHTKRAAYQGSAIWGNCLVANRSMPSPDLFG
ncbi:unnamed protein product [Mytilus edulis]|uniref:Uncharacterized protein n=1 Tax=Mytilus edulis TaxID=6550 RepID=A0A8S3U2R4_MYTED|nr:unnamed protein product [Mytilus edulis]